MPSLPSPERLLRILLTVAAGILGGALFWALNVPLAWMLGAMAATAALAWREQAAVPGVVRPAGLILLGLGLGQTFTPPVMEAVALALGWLVLAGFITILVGALTAKLFARMAGTDSETGYYASVPGGVVVMAVLAQRVGVSVPAVTLAQTIRVIIVVILIPPMVTWLAPAGGAGAFLPARPEVHLPGLAAMVAGGLATALLLSRTGLANAWMLGPCIMTIALSALWQIPSGVPGWMVDAAQVAMGLSLGNRISRRFILSSRRLAWASAVTALVLVVLMAVLAVGFAWVSGLPWGAVALGMAPGGMPEMTVTAKALEVGVPLVLAFHLVRTLLCNLFATAIWRAAVRLGLAR